MLQLERVAKVGRRIGKREIKLQYEGKFVGGDGVGGVLDFIGGMFRKGFGIIMIEGYNNILIINFLVNKSVYF